MSAFAHVLKAINADLLSHAYAAAARFWSYPILLIIAIGIWRGQNRDRSDRPELTA